MANLGRNASPIAVALASLLLWTSFTWGLPAEAPAAADDTTLAQPKGAPETDTAGRAANAGMEVDRTTGWFYLGLGAGESPIKKWGGDLMVNAAAAVKHGRYQGTASATTAGVGATGFDVGLLFGYYPIPKLGISAGVAWARVGECRSYTVHAGWWTYTVDYIEYWDTVGVPVEIRFAPVNGRVVGLGLVAHANFNKKNVFAGATVGIELGKLK